MVSALNGFGGGSGEIFIDNTACNGNESRLEDCVHNGIRNHNCEQNAHNEDAGVICYPGSSLICVPVALTIMILSTVGDPR